MKNKVEGTTSAKLNEISDFRLTYSGFNIGNVVVFKDKWKGVIKSNDGERLVLQNIHTVRHFPYVNKYDERIITKGDLGEISELRVMCYTSTGQVRDAVTKRNLVPGELLEVNKLWPVSLLFRAVHASNIVTVSHVDYNLMLPERSVIYCVDQRGHYVAVTLKDRPTYATYVEELIDLERRTKIELEGRAKHD